MAGPFAFFSLQSELSLIHPQALYAMRIARALKAWQLLYTPPSIGLSHSGVPDFSRIVRNKGPTYRVEEHSHAMCLVKRVR